MKKNKTLLALLLALMLLLTACGAKSEEIPMDAMGTDESFQDAPAEEPEMPMPEEESIEEELEFNTSSQDTPEGMTVEEVETYSDKIIYSGDIYMETTSFDETVAALDQAVREFGGFVQDSSVNGNVNYHDDGTTSIRDRWAHYTVRIPAKKFDAFMALTDGIGNVISSSRTAENVTSQYTDYEARLSSLRTQEERLLKMLEESGDLEALIQLEARLSEVRYEIESIERNLRNLDQRLTFSTVNLDVQEVELYTPSAAVQRTFGEKLSDAFGSGWSNFAYGCQDFVISLAWNLPTLILLALLVVAIVLIVRAVRKKRAKKRAQRYMPPVQPQQPPVQQPKPRQTEEKKP